MKKPYSDAELAEIERSRGHIISLRCLLIPSTLNLIVFYEDYPVCFSPCPKGLNELLAWVRTLRRLREYDVYVGVPGLNHTWENWGKLFECRLPLRVEYCEFVKPGQEYRWPQIRVNGPTLKKVNYFVQNNMAVSIP